MITGRCECGAVRYRVDGAIEDFSHCHCSMCRRLHGAAFVSWGGVPRRAFRLTHGEQDMKLYRSSKNIDRWFCRRCGSSFLAHMKTEAERYYIAMGTVEGNPDLPPGYHFFVASKAPWIEIGDDLPRYDAWPPDSPTG